MPTRRSREDPRSVRLLTAVLVFALVGTPPLPEYPDRGEPLGDRALTADLVEYGHRNGYVPEDLLVETDSGTRRTCLLEREAAQAWELMVVHARYDGLRIEAASCYRSFRAQKSSYEYNCPEEKVAVERTVTTVGEDGEELTTTAVDYVTERVCRVPTARPGRSNHSWGRAIDITSGRRLLTCRSKTFRWLQDHAHLYGWVHPAWAACRRPKEEAWHWEWAGTAMPPDLGRLHALVY